MHTEACYIPRLEEMHTKVAVFPPVSHQQLAPIYLKDTDRCSIDHRYHTTDRALNLEYHAAKCFNFVDIARPYL